MGIFFKEVCDRCGNTVNKTKTFMVNKKDVKTLCHDCLMAMHVDGFIKYRKNILEECDYETLLQYQQMYEDIKSGSGNYYPITIDGDFDKNFNANQAGGCELNFVNVRLNADYITLFDYPCLLVKTSDIIAVTMEESYDFVSLTDAFVKLSFFTKNPLIPYFSTFYIFNKKISFSSKHEKAVMAKVKEAISLYCRGLRYEIDTPAKVLKKVKRDFAYNEVVDKKKLRSWISDDKYQVGYFSTKKILKQFQGKDRVVYDGTNIEIR